MEENNYRSYVGNEKYHFATFEAAKNAAQEFMPSTPELRIEILEEISGADFWAYEYQSKKWVPS